MVLHQRKAERDEAQAEKNDGAEFDQEGGGLAVGGVLLARDGFFAVELLEGLLGRLEDLLLGE